MPRRVPATRPIIVPAVKHRMNPINSDACTQYPRIQLRPTMNETYAAKMILPIKSNCELRIVLHLSEIDSVQPISQEWARTYEEQFK